MKSALIIFVRNPVLGKVKTRIAKDVGDETALEIYKKLLAHTQAVTLKLAVDVFIFYADYLNEQDLWSGLNYQKRLQLGNDLGDRMKDAFSQLFSEGYQHVCIIGSDCFELTSPIIEEAFSALERNKFVIGPTFDGGYYLLGMSELVTEVFNNKEWSNNTVFTDTINDINRLNSSCYLLPKLSDVDTIEDCKKYETLLSLTLQ